jgi:DNA-binding beta-propeller fold protein YncE
MCACNLDNLGDSPPAANIYFPSVLALSTQTSASPPRFLYLVNSNFDLRYNGGSVQAFDLEALNAAVDACATPGPDCEIESSRVIVDEVFIPSQATTLSFSPDHDRMYVATRTDPSLMFIDVDENAAPGAGVFQCEQSAGHCSDARKRGADPNEGPRGRLVLPTEPVSMVTIPVSSIDGSTAMPGEGKYVLLAHREGQASLFYDDGSAGPLLIDIVGNLPPELTDVTFDPMTRLAYVSVFARGSVLALVKVLSRIGIAPNVDPLAAFAYDAGALSIDGVSSSRDTRGVAMSPTHAGLALVVSREPASLLWVDVAGSLNGSLPPTSAPARRIVTMAAGPSRLALGDVAGHSIVAVSCFDSQQVFVMDADSSQVLTIVHNLNGPFELAIDAFRQRLYIADFRSSVVRVLDLGPVVNDAFGGRTDAPILGTLGIPKVVQELQ